MARALLRFSDAERDGLVRPSTTVIAAGTRASGRGVRLMSEATMSDWNPSIGDDDGPTEQGARLVAWVETKASIDTVWRLVAAVERWPRWIPDLTWTSPPLPANDEGTAFQVMWRSILFDGRF